MYVHHNYFINAIHVHVYVHVHCVFVSYCRGVLESLIKRHFPTPTDGNEWSVFENDSTLPRNCRKRKRGIAPLNVTETLTMLLRE